MNSNKSFSRYNNENDNFRTTFTKRKSDSYTFYSKSDHKKSSSKAYFSNNFNDGDRRCKLHRALDESNACTDT